MAVNFGILSQGPSIGERFIQGQEAAEAASERNRLREMQMMQMDAQRENILAQREQRMAQAQDIRAKQDRAAERQQFLTGLNEQLAQGGYKLDRPTLGKVLQFGMQSGEDSLIQYATKGLQALDEEDSYQREIQRLGLGGAPAPANAMAPSAEGAAPAPVNALAQPGINREMVQRMIMSPNPRIREQGKALLGSLPPPKEAGPEDLSKRYVPVGKLVFDRNTQQWIQPPAAAIAATREPASSREPTAPAVKPLTPAQEAARRDKIGREFKSVASALQTTQDVLDSVAAVKGSPGLPGITGVQSFIPSIPGGAAATADVRLQNLRGKVTALGKAQAASSGAIGSIANQEWKILSDQIAAVDPSKGQGPLLEQIDLIEQQAAGAMQRIRDAYERTYGEDFERFPQFKDLPTPQSSRKPKPKKDSAPAASSRTVVRTGTLNGRRVVEYSDGKTEYAD
jgi:hypothetical protein